MKISQELRKWKNSNLFGSFLWNEWRRIREQVIYKQKSDEDFICELYKKRTGKTLNLNNPETFTEKLQWMKIHHKDPLMSICADKYGVREYIKEKGLECILNPLIAVYDSVDDIDYSVLPDKFVLKGTHGSGWIVLCKNKSELDVKSYNRIMRSWLKQNIYYSGREWVYNDIPHRIVCEEYIDANGDDLRDYKIFCFGGKPTYIQVDGDRFSSHKRAYYNLDWNKMSFQYGGYAKDYAVDRPEKLDEMIRIAEILSQPFPFSRIDLYNIEGRIIFGEITFFPDAGFANFDPPEADYEIGKLFELPRE